MNCSNIEANGGSNVQKVRYLQVAEKQMGKTMYFKSKKAVFFDSRGLY